jgi:hypothetical protein
MRNFKTVALATFLSIVAAQTAFAQADDDDDDQAAPKPKAEAQTKAPAVTRASKNLPELILGSKTDDFAVNQKDFELVAGQGYRWKITSAAGFEYKFFTDLFRNVWMNQIVINELEVHMNGAPAWLEFDSPGTINVQFTAVRPGEYTWSVPDLADKGMKGKITVR